MGHTRLLRLLANALRRFGDAGAHFVWTSLPAPPNGCVAPPRVQASHELDAGEFVPTGKMGRLLAVGVDTFRNASLTSLHSRRLAATVFGQAGLVDEVLAQPTTMANVQAPRREGGLSLRQGDPTLLRQVKRPTADADVDFQVYTLREAMRALPVRGLPAAIRALNWPTGSLPWAIAAMAGLRPALPPRWWNSAPLSTASTSSAKIPDNDSTTSPKVGSRSFAPCWRPAEAECAEEQAQKGLIWHRVHQGQRPFAALPPPGGCRRRCT